MDMVPELETRIWQHVVERKKMHHKKNKKQKTKSSQQFVNKQKSNWMNATNKKIWLRRNRNFERWYTPTTLLNTWEINVANQKIEKTKKKLFLKKNYFSIRKHSFHSFKQFVNFSLFFIWNKTIHTLQSNCVLKTSGKDHKTKNLGQKSNNKTIKTNNNN